jgi:hypothetical protein
LAREGVTQGRPQKRTSAYIRRSSGDEGGSLDAHTPPAADGEVAHARFTAHSLSPARVEGCQGNCLRWIILCHLWATRLEGTDSASVQEVRAIVGRAAGNYVRAVAMPATPDEAEKLALATAGGWLQPVLMYCGGWHGRNNSARGGGSTRHHGGCTETHVRACGRTKSKSFFMASSHLHKYMSGPAEIFRGRVQAGSAGEVVCAPGDGRRCALTDER